MKNFRKAFVKVEDLIVDDRLKVAGVLYRITKIETIGNGHVIQFRNVRRPIIYGHLTFETNTLLKIWTQK